MYLPVTRHGYQKGMCAITATMSCLICTRSTSRPTLILPGKSDWTALLARSTARDPAADPRHFAARYPRLAQRMSLPHREITGVSESSVGAGLRLRGEEAVERAATLLHRAIDLAQAAARAALRTCAGQARVRDPVGGKRKRRRPER